MTSRAINGSSSTSRISFFVFDLQNVAGGGVDLDFYKTVIATKNPEFVDRPSILHFKLRRDDLAVKSLLNDTAKRCQRLDAATVDTPTDAFTRIVVLLHLAVIVTRTSNNRASERRTEKNSGDRCGI